MDFSSQQSLQPAPTAESLFDDIMQREDDSSESGPMQQEGGIDNMEFDQLADAMADLPIVQPLQQQYDAPNRSPRRREPSKARRSSTPTMQTSMKSPSRAAKTKAVAGIKMEMQKDAKSLGRIVRHRRASASKKAGMRKVQQKSKAIAKSAKPARRRVARKKPAKKAAKGSKKARK